MKLLTADEVAGILSVSVRTVRRYAASADLPYVKVGRSVRFRLRDVENFTEARVVSRERLAKLARSRILGNP